MGTTALTIDPGEKTGGCIMSAVGSPVAFAIKGPTVWQIHRIVSWAELHAAHRGDTLELVVEDQHVARGPRANPASTITLARRAERWIVSAEQHGVAWQRVQPASWHTALREVPTRDEEGVERTPKQRAKILIARLWPSVMMCRGELGRDDLVECPSAKLPQDTVEAIAMARWRLHGKVKREPAPRRRR